MARTVSEIKSEITGRFVSDETVLKLYDLDPDKTFDEQFSKVSIESILFYTVAYAVWLLEKLFDTHKTEISDTIDSLKPHSLRWYANAARRFQYGHDLPEDSDRYDNTGLSDQQVESSKIVSYAAALEVGTGIRLRVARDAGDDLAPLTAGELVSFTGYMERIKDAGVRLSIASSEADTLRLQLKIFYNPLVLEVYDGKLNRIDGAAADVVSATVKNYLKNLPFNGTLALAYLVDALQSVEGIVIPHVVKATGQYAAVITEIETVYAPDAGYVRLSDDGLIISYEAQTVI
jgi:hypothetical protein